MVEGEKLGSKSIGSPKRDTIPQQRPRQGSAGVSLRLGEVRIGLGGHTSPNAKLYDWSPGRRHMLFLDKTVCRSALTPTKRASS